ncbi:MAG: alpha/beta fold hydrolase [Burkholderiaceae bacterium]
MRINPDRPDPQDRMKFARHLVFALGYALFGVVVAGLVAYGFYVSGLPTLSRWHSLELQQEFRAGDGTRTWVQWLAKEDAVFAELKQKIYARPQAGEGQIASRYTAGALADPTKEAFDWNRSFELPAKNPRGGILLIHGLSDSPYSLRGLAEQMNAAGWTVVALRLPGHGALPSGLRDVSWQDWAEAVRVAARHLKQSVGDKPILLAGYSTGAALALEYSLARLQGEDLPAAAGLVLFSPAIEVSPAAKYAVWQARVAHWLGIPELEWTDVEPEYDPYKFNSFTVNAGDQVYRLTQRIQAQLGSIGKGAPVAGMPTILAFQSVADATVSTPAVVRKLLARLASDGHELVLYDINRHADARPFYKPGALEIRENLLAGDPLAFTLTALANESAESGKINELRRRAGQREKEVRSTGLAWPSGVFSLSHVALPFSPADPVYGALRPEISTLPYLGRIEVQGERGALAVPSGALLRLRHNPFHAYQAERIDHFSDLIARRK